mmetsp:Transcript_10293/g.17068  ORF Transcript_10293/g.17068 Transcript_10293/m.17068 type:complete len:90 (+) Transcript_10293:705-974(+)
MLYPLETCEQRKHANGTKPEVCSKCITNAVSIFNEDGGHANHDSNEEHDANCSTHRVRQASLVCRKDAAQNEQGDDSNQDVANAHDRLG